jgi:hypothetical protein
MSDKWKFIDGLRECTAEDVANYELCQANTIPFTAHWENLDDSMKIMSWDSEWENFIKHRAETIDLEERESYLPWNLYKSLNLNWLDGYNFAQRIGNCCGHAAKNSLKASNFTNARRTGRTPREIALCIAYGIARGNGSMNMGSGLNLNPMARWSATKGNYHTSDFGRYDGGRQFNVRNWRPSSQQDTHALKTQSIVIHLPAPSFDLVYAVCEAGFGINMGTGTYPTGSILGSDNVATPNSWRNGGHAMAFIAAWTAPSGRRYVYLENSHGARYAADRFNPNRQHGCWIDEAAFNQMVRNNPFRYGAW